jgi:hypothetical protein
MPKKKSNFELLKVNADSDNVYTILGISEERSDQMQDLAIEAYKSKEKFVDTIEELVENSENLNEVVFFTLLAARIHDQGQHQKLEKKLEELKSLAEIIKMQSSL